MDTTAMSPIIPKKLQKGNVGGRQSMIEESEGKRAHFSPDPKSTMMN